MPPIDTGIKDSAGAAGSITEYKVYYATSAINDVNAATEWSPNTYRDIGDYHRT